MSSFTSINPTSGNNKTPVVTTSEPVKSSWSGRRIAYAVLGALTALATLIGSLFLMSSAKKEEKKETPEKLLHPTKDRPKIAHKAPTNIKDLFDIKKGPSLAHFIKKQSDEDLAQVLQTMEERGFYRKTAHESIQIEKDRALAELLQEEEPKGHIPQADEDLANILQTMEETDFDTKTADEFFQIEKDRAFAELLQREDEPQPVAHVLEERPSPVIQPQREAQKPGMHVLERPRPVVHPQRGAQRPVIHVLEEKPKPVTQPRREPQKAVGEVPKSKKQVDKKTETHPDWKTLRKNLPKGFVKDALIATKENYLKSKK